MCIHYSSTCYLFLITQLLIATNAKLPWCRIGQHHALSSLYSLHNEASCNKVQERLSKVQEFEVVEYQQQVLWLIQADLTTGLLTSLF